MRTIDFITKHIDNLENTSSISNIETFVYENHTFILYDKYIGKLEAFKHVQKPCLVVFKNNSKRPINNVYYLNNENRNKAIEELKNLILKEKERDLAFSKKRKAETDLIKKDSILYSTYGYEQTNVEFYIVLERKNSVLTIQKVSNELIFDKGDRGHCVPNLNKLIGDPQKVRIGKYNIKIGYCFTLDLWDGKPKYWSDYGYKKSLLRGYFYITPNSFRSNISLSEIFFIFKVF